MAEILRFDTNVPVEVALRFSDGKHVEGRYGDQVMYSLEDNRIMYVPPIVEHHIQELGIDKGERFEVCKAEVKQGGRRSIEWRVSRVDPPAQPEPRQPVARPIAAASTLDHQSTTNNRNGSTNGGAEGHVNGTATPNGAYPVLDNFASGSCSGMEIAMKAAVDIAQQVESHATARNYSLRFTSEDIRAIGLSLFIQTARDGGLR